MERGERGTQPPAWRLDTATVADVETLLPLVRAYHEFEGISLGDDERRAAVTRLLGEPHLGTIWLIKADGAVAGYIVLCIGFSIEFGGHDAFVDEFFILPQYRGRGGGRIALGLLAGAARARDVRAVHLEVARDNARARALYRAAGFEAREKYVLMTLRP